MIYNAIVIIFPWVWIESQTWKCGQNELQPQYVLKPSDVKMPLHTITITVTSRQHPPPLQLSTAEYRYEGWKRDSSDSAFTHKSLVVIAFDHVSKRNIGTWRWNHTPSAGSMNILNPIMAIHSHDQVVVRYFGYYHSQSETKWPQFSKHICLFIFLYEKSISFVVSAKFVLVVHLTIDQISLDKGVTPSRRITLPGNRARQYCRVINGVH